MADEPTTLKQVTKSGRVRILGLEYTVRFVGKDHPELNDDSGKSYYGTISHETNEIFVRTGTTMDRKKEVVLHEVLHAISVELDLGLKEKQISRLTHGLFSAGIFVNLK